MLRGDALLPALPARRLHAGPRSSPAPPHPTHTALWRSLNAHGALEVSKHTRCCALQGMSPDEASDDDDSPARAQARRAAAAAGVQVKCEVADEGSPVASGRAGLVFPMVRVLVGARGGGGGVVRVWVVEGRCGCGGGAGGLGRQGGKPAVLRTCASAICGQLKAEPQVRSTGLLATLPLHLPLRR
jgi:hypothetical protein